MNNQQTKKPRIELARDPDTGWYMWWAEELEIPFLGYVKETSLTKAMYKYAQLRIN